MKKLICLCSGSGERLKPVTDKIHKSMIRLKQGGLPIISNSIWKINEAFDDSLDEVIIVCRQDFYDKYNEEVMDTIPYNNLKVIFVINDNTYYNNWYSAYLAFSQEVEDDDHVLVIEGDILIDYFNPPNEFSTLLNEKIKEDPDESYSFCRYRENEWVLVETEKGKKLIATDSNGYALTGITYLSPSMVQKVKKSLNSAANSYDLEYNPYYEKLFWDECLDFSKIKIVPIEYPDVVQEIDTIQDLANIIGAQNVANMITEDFAVPMDSMTNENFLVTYNGKQQIFKIPGAGTDTFIDRNRGDMMTQYFEDLNTDYRVIPETKSYCNGVKLVEYFDRCRTSVPSSHDFLRIHKLLGKIHKIGIPGDKFIWSDYLIDLVKELELYESLYDEKSVTFPKEYKKMRDFYVDIIRKEQYNHLTLCHRDLDLRNMLFEKDTDRIHLIDFEYSGYLNRYWDLGAYISELILASNDLRENIIYSEGWDAYTKVSGYEVKPSEVYLWSGIVDFIWSCWTIAKMSVGVQGLEEYLRMRWEACVTTYEHYTGVL